MDALRVIRIQRVVVAVRTRPKEEDGKRVVLHAITFEEALKRMVTIPPVNPDLFGGWLITDCDVYPRCCRKGVRNFRRCTKFADAEVPQGIHG